MSTVKTCTQLMHCYEHPLQSLETTAWYFKMNQNYVFVEAIMYCTSALLAKKFKLKEYSEHQRSGPIYSLICSYYAERWPASPPTYNHSGKSIVSWLFVMTYCYMVVILLYESQCRNTRYTMVTGVFKNAGQDPMVLFGGLECQRKLLTLYQPKLRANDCHYLHISLGRLYAQTYFTTKIPPLSSHCRLLFLIS